MKTQILTLALCFSVFTAMAQVKAPAPSPGCEIEQMIGLTEVSVEYSRPGMKGRKIFGGLVSYDKMWRTGANKNTIVEFEHDVTINGKDLEAGSYALFTKPGKETWEFVFYSDTENWGVPEKMDESKIALKATSKVMNIKPAVETFTISFDNLTNNDAEMNLTWENTKVGVTVGVPTAKMTMESIDQVLSGPTFRDYYSAAKYYRQEGKDLKQAVKWIDMAVKNGGDTEYWVLREKAMIHAAMEDYKGAIEAAKMSSKAATAAGNKDYIRMNEESIAEWKKKMK